MRKKTDTDTWFLESIIENIPDMVFVKDARDGRFVRVNKAGEELLGYSRDALIGKTDHDVFPKEEADFFVAKDREALEGREPVEVLEEPIHTRSRGTRILHTLKIPLLDDDGEALYLLGIAEDITDRKQLDVERRRRAELEEAKRTSDELAHHLKVSQSRLASVIESVPDALLAVDAGGEVVEVNSGALEVFAAPNREDLLGHVEALLTLVQPQGNGPVAGMHWEDLHAITSRGETVITLGLLKRPDETHVDVLVRASPMGRQESSGATLLIIRDITEQRRLETLRDEFLSVAAHELKTPLANIKGYADLMTSWTEDERKESEPQALEVIKRQTDKLNRLIEELMEFSRLQLGRLELNEQPLRLDELVETVVDELRATTSKHELRIEAIRPILVEADRDRIEQVLANLLGNAIKFSPKGGEIRISVEQRDEGAVVTIRDFGLGIPAQKQSGVFQRYFQAHKETQYAMTAGLGMGLYVSKELVERHGGSMGFESEEGVGSTFHFTLPMDALTTPKDEPRPRRRVLVVDDDDDLLDLTSLALEREGFMVDVARHGQEALERVDHSMPDLILLDMRMPVMDGWTFAKEFRAHHGAAAPIVVVTAAADARKHAEDVSADGFVSKPFSISKLLSVVRASIRTE